MAKSAAKRIARTREKIARIRGGLGQIEYLCTGTLIERMKICGKLGCRCAQDPQARHGPYYEWGHMKGGRLVHRMVTREQAALLRQAIDNYRAVKRLLRAWEAETERLVDLEVPRES